VKLIRTIRLDPSDTFVFDRAAEPGEWAVTGSFVFLDADAAALQGKARTAFRSGFLGIASLGWSTLVEIVEATDRDRADATDLLARRLQEEFGAPTGEVAQLAAAEEIAFAASLCDHPAGTLVALHRTQEEGALRERFRTLRRREGERPLRAFAFVDVEGESHEPGEEVDLAGLASAAGPRTGGP
jgi:hypothetical protein